MRPFFSIIVATYNSEKTLRYTLQSIREQQIDKNEYEVLVVDGGSTDRTLEIAAEYHARVLQNPDRLPEYAKAVGVRHARGVYAVRMDSDEEFSYPHQLQDKMDFLKKHPEVKMLLSNRYAVGRKDICGIAAEYMNILGDPFSYFIYRSRYDKYRTYRRNVIREDGNEVVMRFGAADTYPLADSATCALSLDYMREAYPEEYDTIGFICRAYDVVLADTELCGLLKSDVVLHNCSSSFKTYLSKLRFRVINNLFHKEEGGFSAKEGINPRLRKRKLLFCLYALLVPLPILDSIRLALVYRNASYLLHFVYLYYVCVQIAVLGTKKLLGKDVRNSSYGK